MKALVLDGPNHAFDKSAPVIHEFLSKSVDSTLSDDKEILAKGLDGFDVLVFGTGFTRRERLPDGSRKLHYELSDAQEEGLYRFVRGGKGLVGIHRTGWWTAGKHAELAGGHANWHPPGLHFTVKVEDGGHPIMTGLSDFEVDDEIYMSAYDPTVHILASAEWSNVNHPMAWTHRFGDGRVFFTTLGHGPNTFEVPAVQRMMTNAVVWASGRG